MRFLSGFSAAGARGCLTQFPLNLGRGGGVKALTREPLHWPKPSLQKIILVKIKKIVDRSDSSS